MECRLSRPSNLPAGICGLLAVALIAGCYTRPVLRDSWPEQVRLESTACPVIDGDYQNAGESGHRFVRHIRSMNSAISLAHLLNGQFDLFSYRNPDRLGATTSDPSEDTYRVIRIRQLSGVLRIEGERTDGRRAAFGLPTPAECRDSLLVLSGWAADTLDGPYPVAARNELAFGRFADGSLLVRAGTSLPTPGVGYRLVLFEDSYFYRFLPVKPAETRTADH